MMTLRQSILNSYEVCPFMCKEEWGTIEEPKEYVYNEEASPNKYAATGVAFHSALEYWADESMAGRVPTLLTCHDKLDEKFRELSLDLFKDKEDVTKFYNSLHEQLTWVYEQSLGIMPIASEKRFTIEGLIPGLPCTCTGTIDRVDGSMERQDVDLVDYKSGKVYTKKELSENIQATMYALAWKHLYGFYPKRFIFLFSKHKKTKIIHINEDFLQSGIARIKGIYYHMVNGDFEPNPKNKMFCKNFCKCYKKCPQGYKKGWDSIGWEQFIPNV